jgi:phosphoenolpyruvate-protein phosphotransferase (PTS system enzyme I)
MRLTGIGVSPGVAMGRALVFKQRARDVRFRVPDRDIPREVARLEAARERSREQLRDIRTRIARIAGAEHAYLFDAQLLMLDDPMLVERAAAFVRDERLNPEWALRRAGDELSAVFDDADDPYLRERKGDIADVVGRLALNLRGRATGPTDLIGDLDGPFLLIADNLAPSVAAQVDWRQVAGFATDAGSWTYHTAILARSLHVPAVVGLHDASARIPPGATVAIDGTSGEVLVDPPAAALQQFQERRKRRAAYERSLDEFRQRPAVTRDGLAIRLEANIERLEDIARAREYGASGIGLYRSEFLVGSGPVEAVSEERQYAVYRAMLEQMAPDRVTIRTFDVSSDQLAGQGNAEDGAPERLTLRGIRLSLAHREPFRRQLRALLRAARHGQLRVMFPFVSGVEELRAARALAAEVRHELGAEAPANVPIGVMIEVPSAALTADLLAEEADFFSIGTNDLIQYCLAVDRTDDRVSHLYEPLHPAILRAIRLTVRAARRRRLPLSVCGEMASDPALLALLVGFGITEFSMAPSAVPVAKRVLAELDAGTTRAAVGRALRCRTAQEVERQLTTSLTDARQAGLDATAAIDEKQ